MLHPPGFGELLPEQAVLVLLALIALFSPPRRKAAILILGWLIFATIPAALIKPLGVGFVPEPGKMPTPHVLFDFRLPRDRRSRRHYCSVIPTRDMKFWR